jgi:hypothetical protein
MNKTLRNTFQHPRRPNLRGIRRIECNYFCESVDVIQIG